DTPIDFSNFIMNQLGVNTLTPELLARPTYELMRGSCTSLTEPLPLIPNNRGRRVIPFVHFINNDLEYLRGGASIQKYTTSVTKTKAADYGHIKWNEDLPLPLIPNNRGRRVIPFAHFINNDLEYLRGGASIQKCTTSVTKAKAADYGHIKWNEDLVPLWIQESLNYDKHAL
nr:hypothetical protein [Tanacetum cinerariifolium]